MKSTPFLAILCVASLLAPDVGAKTEGKNSRAKPKVIDLDFTDDDESAPIPASAGTVRAQAPADSHEWLYWTLGATVVAGGVGWYLSEGSSKEPTVTRNEQIFTDERN
ncbi:MAG: hypothetical protein JWP91_2836 [Fibrobacteres bacterium]|nr:hypothetical protein [Fibrobacterota bacterium]